jgi:WD40 repeat protein
MLVTCGEAGEVKYRSRDDAGAAQTVIKALGQANRMRVCPGRNELFAVGGDKSDLRIWDVNSAKKAVYQARNVKPDKLQLEQPRCVNDLAFIPGTGGTRLVTGTKYREFRLYDTKVQSRPIINNIVSEFAINSICVHPNGNEVYIGDVAGGIQTIDLRTFRNSGNFRGNSGSVRSLVSHLTLHSPFFLPRWLTFERPVTLHGSFTISAFVQLFYSPPAHRIPSFSSSFASHVYCWPRASDLRRGVVGREERGEGVGHGLPCLICVSCLHFAHIHPRIPHPPLHQQACHPTLPYLVSCGLDRYMRVYNTDTKRGVASIYLKQRLNQVIVSNDESIGIELDEARCAFSDRTLHSMLPLDPTHVR